MDLIKEMANLLEQDRPKSFHLIIPKGSKLHKLYKLAHKNSDDKKASKKLYGSDSKDKRYLMLKNSLIKKLSELVLVANHSDINRKNFIRVRFEAEKQLTIANKLLFLNVYHNAERITKKALKNAEDYHLVELERECYNVLRKIYYLKGFPKKAENFHQLASRKYEESLKQNEAVGYLQIFLAEIKFIRSQSPGLADRCNEVVNRLREISIESPYYTITILRICLIQRQQSCMFDDWIKDIEGIKHMMSKYPYLKTEHLILETSISEVRYHILRNSFDHAKELLLSLQECTAYKLFNKFEVMAEVFQLQMHQENYAMAYATLKEVTKTAEYKRLDKRDTASWALRGAYLKYMLDTPWSLTEVFDSSKLHDLIATCAPISKDRVGFNLQFQIIKTLWMIQKPEPDYLGEYNNLKVYHQRYLKGNIASRSKAFYKTLLKLLKDPKRKNADKLGVELGEKLESVNHSLDFCEVVRYDLLWKSIYSHFTSQPEFN